MINATGISSAIETVNKASIEDLIIIAEKSRGTAAPNKLDEIEYTLNPRLLVSFEVVSVIIKFTKGILAE